MRSVEGIDLSKVQEVYSGPEGDLWELIMGEQIHIGGFSSSMALAGKATIGKGMKGADLCCCNGAGMRFLIRFRDVDSMIGVDATQHVIDRGIERCKAEGLSDRIQFKNANVMETRLPAEGVDFVWGEDAWCYVESKERLISEAARIVKKEGSIAFTDWVEGSMPMSDAEAERFLKFMKFPNVFGIDCYVKALKECGCEIIIAEDTGQFAPHIDLYLDMLNKQFTYDALKIIGFNMEMMQGLGAEMVFMQGLAHAKKIAQARIIARKK